MPAPKLEECGDTTRHDPHFWEKEDEPFLEGFAYYWCKGIDIWTKVEDNVIRSSLHEAGRGYVRDRDS